MDVGEFMEIVNEGHSGWIPSDYSFRYYDIGKNYPILNLSIENNKILLPIEFVIYPFCDNASEIPMIISNRNSILVISIWKFNHSAKFLSFKILPRVFGYPSNKSCQK